MHFDRLDESYTMVKSNLNFGKVTLTGLTGLRIPVRPVCRVQNFPKPYLSHPESKSDIPHMYFDRLDEIYAMVKSILHFEQLDQTGLTGFMGRSDRSSQSCHFLVRTRRLSILYKFVEQNLCA